MDQRTLERAIRKFRYHVARSVTRLSGFSSEKKRKTKRPQYPRRINAEYKTAHDLLVAIHLELEEDLTAASDPTTQNRLRHWIAIVELCFNTFVWIAERWDRDRVKRVFKGPKHGSSSSRNVQSVLYVVNQMNKRWNDLAIALDFTSFECISDVLRVHIHPKLKGIQNLYIEVKEGRVNEEMLETIESRSQERYFSFFEKYGEPGIKQLERYFRQGKTADERIAIMREADGGVFETPHGMLHVEVPSTARMYYTKDVKNLLKYIRNDPFGSFVVDGCLWVGAARTGAPESVKLADFLARHAVNHLFNTKCFMCAEEKGWEQQLADITLFDGLRMFGAVPFESLVGRPISDRDMLDILFGRVRFFYHLHGDRFIELCRNVGLEAGYSTKKQFNRFRSTSKHETIGFRGRLLWVGRKDGNARLFFSMGMLHDICLNWIHPYWWARQMLESRFLLGAGATGTTAEVNG